METIQRNTAYKVWIAHLISGIYTKGQEQFDSGYVMINNKRVSRVNVVGGIIEKFSGEGYMSVNIDDGSGILSLRAWKDDMHIFENVDIGDLVLVVGKVKSYNNIIYASPEFLRRLDNPLWLKVRKLELVKEYGEVGRVEVKRPSAEVSGLDSDYVSNVVEEKVSNSNNRETLLSLI